MPVVGRVSQVWRYPVKSMAGEQLQRSMVQTRGLAGDRGWALRDEHVGEIRGAKKLYDLLRCAARYLEEPAGDSIPAAEITFPDGARLRCDDPAAAASLSALLRRPVTVWPRQPASDRDFYRRAKPDTDDFMSEVRAMFGRTEGEPIPDLLQFPQELLQFTSPLGTYFDAFPLHLLTTASLAAMREHNPGGDFDARRFRPNLLIETVSDCCGLVEFDWCGRVLRIGSAGIAIALPAVRCVMPTLAQVDLPKDPSVLRTVVRHAGQNLGVYATVEAPGTVALGDVVELE
ncbi:MAG: MOSC domain-containing protein [Deltaproteobacteria bacterium]|nr:MOSC domain-containing protein [Deltaproteobacteria bacterium]